MILSRFTVKIPITSSTTDTRSETDFKKRGWRNNLAMTIYYEFNSFIRAIRCTYIRNSLYL